MTCTAPSRRIDELCSTASLPRRRLTIGAALERELTRLLVDRGVPEAVAGGAAREGVDAGSFERSSDSTPSAVGEAVARSSIEG